MSFTCEDLVLPEAMLYCENLYSMHNCIVFGHGTSDLVATGSTVWDQAFLGNINSWCQGIIPLPVQNLAHYKPQSDTNTEQIAPLNPPQHPAYPPSVPQKPSASTPASAAQD